MGEQGNRHGQADEYPQLAFLEGVAQRREEDHQRCSQQGFRRGRPAQTAVDRQQDACCREKLEPDPRRPAQLFRQHRPGPEQHQECGGIEDGRAKER